MRAEKPTESVVDFWQIEEAKWDAATAAYLTGLSVSRIAFENGELTITPVAHAEFYVEPTAPAKESATAAVPLEPGSRQSP